MTILDLNICVAPCPRNPDEYIIPMQINIFSLEILQLQCCRMLGIICDICDIYLNVSGIVYGEKNEKKNETEVGK